MNQTRTLLQIATKVKVLRFAILEGLIVKKRKQEFFTIKNFNRRFTFAITAMQVFKPKSLKGKALLANFIIIFGLFILGIGLYETFVFFNFFF